MTTLRDGHPWDEAGFTYESNVSPADLAGVFAAAAVAMTASAAVRLMLPCLVLQ